MARRRTPRKRKTRRPRRKGTKSPRRKPRRGNFCSFCDKKMNVMPYECRRCGKLFCGNHRIPESHECRNLKRGQGHVFQFKPKPQRESEHVDAPISTATEHRWDNNGSKRRWRSRKPSNRFSTHRLRISRMYKALIILLVLSFGLPFLTLLIDVPYTSEISWTSLYLIEIIVLYIILKRMDRIRVNTDLRIWGLRILSGLFILFGGGFVFLFGFSAAMIGSTQMMLFSFIGGCGLMLIGIYLEFKYMRRAGSIVFLR